MTLNFLHDDELPPGLSYPDAFKRLVDRGLVYFEPWFVLEGHLLRSRLDGLRERYPLRILLPFARREDSDDVACWDSALPGRVVIVHDFASAGWEQRAVLDDFYAWVRLAVETMIEYDIGQQGGHAVS
jgi:hypothetical protein